MKRWNGVVSMTRFYLDARFLGGIFLSLGDEKKKLFVHFSFRSVFGLCWMDFYVCVCIRISEAEPRVRGVGDIWSDVRVRNDWVYIFGWK